MHINAIKLDNNLFAAPMAGITDRPFRTLCKKLGAGYAVSEMVTSRRNLWDSKKTTLKANHTGECGPIAVQITGTQPEEMAEAAKRNIDCGAQVIDINMGCPAKKVCQKWAGSALMQDEPLALKIIEAVVQTCSAQNIPVTLKMRTGWSQHTRNAPALARAAQDAGIAMLTIHGRTREQGYRGEAEYETIATIKNLVHIPVVANGDIDSPAKARFVLEQTGADALMIGRAAQRKPWIFREIHHFLQTGQTLPPPTTLEVSQWIAEYLQDHYSFYGEFTGVRHARKSIGWIIHDLPDSTLLRQRINQVESTQEQTDVIMQYLAQLAQIHAFWPQNNPSTRGKIAPL